MIKIKIKAKFIGRNSLGYITNTTYDIYVINSGFHMGGSQGSSITIGRANDNFGDCVYSSIETFLKNWDLISCSSTNIEDDTLMGVLTSIIRESKIEKILK